MTNYAYYNEHEPYAAEWLRNLMTTGLIAPGYVDERDIQDVETYDLQGFFQHHFFAGIGIWSHALRKCGWPDDRPVITGSCPCQPFSCAGSGRGLADDRHLWPDFFRLIRQMRPQLVLGEQVASPGGLAWFDAVSFDLEGEGYAVGAVDLCAAGFGAPHIRQRLYWMAHAGQPRGWGHGRTISREEAEGSSPRIQAGSVPDQPLAAGAARDLAATERHRLQGSQHENNRTRSSDSGRRPTDSGDSCPGNLADAHQTGPHGSNPHLLEGRPRQEEPDAAGNGSPLLAGRRGLRPRRDASD